MEDGVEHCSHKRCSVHQRHRHSINGIKQLKLLTSTTTTIETFIPSIYKVLFSTRDQTSYL